VGLTAKDGGGLGAAASVIAVVGTAIGSLRLWQGLSLT